MNAAITSIEVQSLDGKRVAVITRDEQEPERVWAYVYEGAEREKHVAVEMVNCRPEYATYCVMAGAKLAEYLDGKNKTPDRGAMYAEAFHSFHYKGCQL